MEQVFSNKLKASLLVAQLTFDFFSYLKSESLKRPRILSLKVQVTKEKILF